MLHNNNKIGVSWWDILGIFLRFTDNMRHISVNVGSENKYAIEMAYYRTYCTVRFKLLVNLFATIACRVRRVVCAAAEAVFLSFAVIKACLRVCIVV